MPPPEYECRQLRLQDRRYDRGTQADEHATETQISLVPHPLTLPASFAMAFRDVTSKGNEGYDEDGDGEYDDADALMVPAELMQLGFHHR